MDREPTLDLVFHGFGNEPTFLAPSALLRVAEALDTSINRIARIYDVRTELLLCASPTAGSIRFTFAIRSTSRRKVSKSKKVQQSALLANIANLSVIGLLCVSALVGQQGLISAVTHIPAPPSDGGRDNQDLELEVRASAKKDGLVISGVQDLIQAARDAGVKKVILSVDGVGEATISEDVESDNAKRLGIRSIDRIQIINLNDQIKIVEPGPILNIGRVPYPSYLATEGYREIVVLWSANVPPPRPGESTIVKARAVRPADVTIEDRDLPASFARATGIYIVNDAMVWK